MKLLFEGAIFIVLFFPFVALAHVPYFESEIIKDISISQVHYYEVSTVGIKEIKLVSNGEKLYLMFAVPKIERLKNFRPKLTLIAPQGEILLEFNTEGVEPRVYHEEFADTYEWIYFDDHFETVPGTYRLIVECYDPGKFWVAVGKIERFGILDILRLPTMIRKIKSFHEQ
ncbi:MAG: hypothetical protein ACK4E2_04545 [Pseudothermotoga sp.]